MSANCSANFTLTDLKGTITEALTVEYSRSPGRNLRRKTMSALKIQLHTMLLSTSYNSYKTVVLNLGSCMTDVAGKTLAYLRCFAQDTDRLSKTLRGKLRRP